MQHLDNNCLKNIIESLSEKKDEFFNMYYETGNLDALAESHIVQIIIDGIDAHIKLHDGEDATMFLASKADIERIVAIACREQRYKCVDAVASSSRYGISDPSTSKIQNAPAPSAADVLAEFEKGNGDTQ